MHKSTTKYNKTQSKWCINKHGASETIDTFETYQVPQRTLTPQNLTIFFGEQDRTVSHDPLRGRLEGDD
jgi:hypothetical protein